MSTLDSWIDRDELAALASELASGTAPVADPPDAPPPVPPSAEEAARPEALEEPALSPEPPPPIDAPENPATSVEEPEFSAPDPVSPTPDVPESPDVTASEPPLPEAPPVETPVPEPEPPAPESAVETQRQEPEPPVSFPDPDPDPDPDPGPTLSEAPPESPAPEPSVTPVEPGITEDDPAAGEPSLPGSTPAPQPALPASALDFDKPEAYAATPFPAPEIPQPDSPVSPLRRTAAVQAAEALERARDRAEQAGLLRPAGATPLASDAADDPAASPAAAALAPLSSYGSLLVSGEPSAVGQETISPAEIQPTAPAVSAASATAFAPEPVATSSSADETDAACDGPGAPSFRERLRGFASRVAEATGSGDIAITDFQSYPLLPGAGSAPVPHSALRLAHWFGSMTQELKASRDGVSHIALGPGAWLCVVAAGSAAGGVCATFRVAQPLEGDLIRALTEDLRLTLREAPAAA